MSAEAWTEADADAITALAERACDLPAEQSGEGIRALALEALDTTITCRADLAAAIAIYAYIAGDLTRQVLNVQPGGFAGIARPDGVHDGDPALTTVQLLTAATNQDGDMVRALAVQATRDPANGGLIFALQLKQIHDLHAQQKAVHH